MPTKIARPCQVPICSRKVTNSPRCSEHQQAKDQVVERERGTASQRGYGSAWKKLSDWVKSVYPICQMCNEKPSQQVDHIIPRAFGGSDDPSNLQALCGSCHSKKTWGETRGNWRKRLASRVAA